MTSAKRNAALLGIGLSALFALVQFRLIVFVFGANYGRAVNAAKGVVDGRPHWRVFQNRVLGPYLVEGLSQALPSYLVAHVVYSIATLAVMSYLAWRLGHRLGGSIGSALLALFVFEAGFAFLLSPPWLYAWDYTSIILFLLFVTFVAEGKSWVWFTGLTVVAMFNRESAEFPALWMILEALVRLYRTRHQSQGERRDWLMLIAGILCLIAGYALVEYLRRTLLIEEVGPKLFPDANQQPGQIQMLQLFTNLELASGMLTQFRYDMGFLILVFLAVSTALTIAITRVEGGRYLALGLTFLVMEGASFTFGYLTETRIFVEMIPLLVLAALLLSRPAIPTAATPEGPIPDTVADQASSG
jgi:hypothetical protein